MPQDPPHVVTSTSFADLHPLLSRYTFPFVTLHGLYVGTPAHKSDIFQYPIKGKNDLQMSIKKDCVKKTLTDMSATIWSNDFSSLNNKKIEEKIRTFLSH